MKNVFRLLMLLAGTVISVSATSVSLAAGQTVVTSARVWDAPDSTRMVFELTNPVQYKVLTLDNPPRLVLDLKNAKRKADFSKLNLANSPVKGVRTAPRENNEYRIVLDLKDKVASKSFLLPANGQDGHRLVLDLFAKGKPKPVVQASTQSMAAAPASKVTPQAKTVAQVPVRQVSPEPKNVPATQPVDVVKTDISGKRDIIIMIDPGHGGDDPGAIGPGKVREKDVVLAISKALRDQINQQKGYKAYLTRESDYYLALRKRSSLAREHNADLLVSVHADAFTRKEASGASVFALSERGATSETARWLAQRENAADLIGGDGSVSLDDKDKVLAGVLLDLSSTASLKASLNVGDHVLRSIGGLSRLHKPSVQQAGFMVLKSPDIPSILVETGFISNPEESRKLNTRKYQQKIAQAISNGVIRYFDQVPPPGTLVAWNKQKRQELAANSYIVKKGDTLSLIASRNAVSIDRLRQLNGLRHDRISPGQELRLPSSG